MSVEARKDKSLTVYEKPVEIVSLNFNVVDQHKIEDPNIAYYAIKEGMFEFQTYTIGTWFPVKESSSMTWFVEEGFWVG